MLFVGVAMVAPRVVRPLASILGAPGARIGGSAGKLARQNAMRNPARTASTAAAIMIGISLITFVAVLGQGLRSSFTSAVDELFVADYNVSGGTDSALSNKAAPAVAKAPGVEAVSEIRDGEAKIGGKSVGVTGVDGEPHEGREHEVVERLQQRSRAAGERRRLRHEALRRRPLAEDRVARHGEDADGQGAAASCRRRVRRAEGRIAVRGRVRSRRPRSTARSPTTTTRSPSRT